MVTDIFGNIPKVGNILIFNPPSYKGVLWGKVCGFTNKGLPKIDDYGNKNNIMTGFRVSWDIEQKGYYTIHTNYVIR